MGLRENRGFGFWSLGSHATSTESTRRELTRVSVKLPSREGLKGSPSCAGGRGMEDYELFSCVPVARLPRRSSAVFEVPDAPPSIKQRIIQAARSPTPSGPSKRSSAGGAATAPGPAVAAAPAKTWSVAIHGGEVSSTPEQTYRAEIERIVKASSAVLDAGGSADDAMEATILLMENSMSRASLSSSQGR